MITRQTYISVLFIFISLSCWAGLDSTNYDFVVAKDGSGDFYSVQEAINAVPDYRKICTTIFIKNGQYKEKIVLPASKNGIRMVGEDVNETVITYNDYAAKKNRFGEEMGTTGSSSFFLFGNEFYACNITFENSSGDIGQAVTMRVDGDKVMFENCRFLGNQDTLYPHGENSRQYYKDCYIEGTVDFIFGWATAVFENCEIVCKRGGYITAASTNQNSAYGFVFLNCKINGPAPQHSVYLGRPWRPYAKTAFIACELSNVISPEGWHNWNKKEAEQTTVYAEYGNKGDGAQTNQRVKWAIQLSDEEVLNYTAEKVLNMSEWNFRK